MRRILSLAFPEIAQSSEKSSTDQDCNVQKGKNLVHPSGRLMSKPSLKETNLDTPHLPWKFKLNHLNRLTLVDLFHKSSRFVLRESSAAKIFDDVVPQL